MRNVLKWLEGKRTYLLAGAAGLVIGLEHFHVLADPTAQFLLKLLGAGSVATLRAALAKVNAVLPPQS